MPAIGTQRIVKVRRDYNAWVADETLEDYALRFTPRLFRKWSEFRVANTALGAISFLALEAIGGSLALNFGFLNSVLAIGAVSLLIFLTGLPISYHAANSGVDMDLLTRGAGFGYLGSTVTSLIYAGFTFIFFALEAAIMALALQMYCHMPLALGYLLCSLAIVPLVTFGITLINRLQSWTQPLWVVLLVAPYLAIAIREPRLFAEWTTFAGTGASGREFSLVAFGAACTVVFALVVQIGEQVDFLRFLPPRTPRNRVRWWCAMLLAGPGWIVPGALKMLGGAFLTFLALQHEIDTTHAVEPTQMYLVAFRYVFASPQMALGATTLFVLVSQLKINVTNAYAGSLAWSNFFARLTHSHPGRVVWLVFNVLIALLLVELGVFGALTKVLTLYSNVAIAWIGALVGDLVISKPLGYSPREIEFKRAHLFDVNPVGVGAMAIATACAALSRAGCLGAVCEALTPFVALFVAFVCAPAIAIATHGRFYVARDSASLPGGATLRCVICENRFEREDMAHCPAYAGAICSLCCSLDSRCGDVCKPHARLGAQVAAVLARTFPWLTLTPRIRRIGLYVASLSVALTVLGGALYLVYYQSATTLSLTDPFAFAVLARGYVKVFFALALVSCIGVWWLVLARETRTVSLEETRRQTTLLLQEIAAHGVTDARLQQASAAADAANRAKSRYVTGLSHELRTPLNSILGYAQLLLRTGGADGGQGGDIGQRDAIATIYRSGEHLLALVDGLLDIARIEAGKLQLDVAEVALPEMVTQLSAMMRPHATEKGLAFSVLTQGCLPRIVRADDKRVRQILINLLSNAVRFTAHGTVTLRIRYAWGLARFEIEDTGAGIPDEQLQNIFLPFERGASAGRNDNGTGLGLTICTLLTEMMGGTLDVKSEVGRGTCFVLQLFLPEVHDPHRRAAHPHDVLGYHGPRKTVLVVDDLTEQRQLIARMLTPLGFSVMEAAGGPQALQLLALQAVDLIIVDVSMPVMDGFEASRLIRQNRLSAAPILVLSANAFDGDRSRGAAAGCDDYLAKPVRVPLLLEKIASLLRLEWRTDARDPVPASALSSATGGNVPDGPARARVAGDAAMPETSRTSAPAPPAPLPEALLADLRRHLDLGYMQGFIACLDAARRATPELGPTLAPLREAAGRFRLADLEALLLPPAQARHDAA
ncbi:ATP-binding protein [Robbsia sp. Bb-Pol-6]|uniref:histidine kinase n=1 Tax=Robbsia betulipollinis TaxID=2981849 RepID=A0ABT3ZHP9_9BURK|nr:ATP-binding protein [Robbsia betulipollinis]MCY0385877.1 ATP-binding protein [Robbsia betulipollinis]